jgi:hypothetical protein
MSTAQQMVWLFVLAIPVASVAWTITHEEVFPEPRQNSASNKASTRQSSTPASSITSSPANTASATMLRSSSYSSPVTSSSTRTGADTCSPSLAWSGSPTSTRASTTACASTSDTNTSRSKPRKRMSNKKRSPANRVSSEVAPGPKSGLSRSRSPDFPTPKKGGRLNSAVPFP